MMFDPRHETRELGLFLLFDTARESFIRAEVYNLQRSREFSNYPVYWAGHISNEESLNYLKSIVDSNAPAIPILIRTARNHPKMAVRKLAIQVLGQTGDERAVAFFRELLSKD
jgi:HEAT repeat protein